MKTVFSIEWKAGIVEPRQLLRVSTDGELCAGDDPIMALRFADRDSAKQMLWLLHRHPEVNQSGERGPFNPERWTITENEVDESLCSS